MSATTVWVVQAYRFGDRDRHSYVVGVYPKKMAALKAADLEDGYRGGKYAMEVTEWELGKGIAGDHIANYPKITRGVRTRTARRSADSAKRTCSRRMN